MPMILRPIDVYNLPAEIMPMLVFSTDVNSIRSRIIRWGTDGECSHVMWLWRRYYLATTGLFYGEVPIIKYLRNSTMWFFRLVDPLPTRQFRLSDSISSKLVEPWYKRRYDVLAMLGHALGVQYIQSPWCDNCVETVVDDLFTAYMNSWTPTTWTPQELFRWCKSKYSGFDLHGIYQPN